MADSIVQSVRAPANTASLVISAGERAEEMEALLRAATSILVTIQESTMLAHLPADPRGRDKHQRAYEMLSFLTDQLTAFAERERLPNVEPVSVVLDDLRRRFPAH